MPLLTYQHLRYLSLCKLSRMASVGGQTVHGKENEEVIHQSAQFTHVSNYPTLP